MWYDGSQRQINREWFLWPSVSTQRALATKRLSYFRKLPRAIRQMIVDIWRAGVRARSVERQRPAPIRLGITHDVQWVAGRGYRWPRMHGPGNNAIATYNAEHSYAYGGNPAHYVLTTPSRYNGFQSYINAFLTHERDDRGTNMTDTFGNTLTKLIEYVLPRPPSRYSGTAEVMSENLRLRRIRRVRWVDRMI
jgi:hypothetical protein